MNGFANFLDLLLEDLFGWSSGLQEAQQEITETIKGFTDTVVSLGEDFQKVFPIFSDFLSPTASSFILTCVVIWGLVMGARVVKGFLGG